MLVHKILFKDFIVGLGVKFDNHINKENMLLLTAQGSASIVPPPFVPTNVNENALVLLSSVTSLLAALASRPNSMLTVQG